MNILSINKYFWKKGGSESVFFNEKKMLESNGHSVIPFSMQGDKNESSLYSQYFIDEVDYSKAGIKNRLLSTSKIIYSFEAKKKITKLLSDSAADLAHFHIFQHQISPSVFGPLRKKKIPIILTLHDLKPMCPNYKMYTNGRVCEECKGGKFYNCFKNRCTKGSLLGSVINTVEMYFHYAMGYYQDVDRFIAVSKFYKNKMIEFGFPESKISYLPNYVDVDDFNVSDDKGYVLFFGRLSEEKGISTLLESAKQNKDIPYHIAGTGPLEKEFKQKVVRENLTNVKFLGFKSGKDLKKTISEATCVVTPSEWYENCPMTVLESLASGVPVIGSDIGGIPELINDKVDGFIFKTGNSIDLSEKIQCIWSDRKSAKAMGLKGRRKISEEFNAEAHYVGLMAIYNSVIKKPS